MEKLQTLFASAERADIRSILFDHRSFALNDWASDVVHMIPSVLIVLNKYRQIVYMNRRLSEVTGKSESELLGKRPGEVLSCIHANEMEAGCGTSESCKECGAIKVVLACQNEKTEKSGECRIRAQLDESMDFKIWAYPYDLNHEHYTVVSMLDIEDEKRRKALEFTFFHDINNTLSAISNYSQLLKKSNKPEKSDHYADMVRNASSQLINEISSQKNLLDAEHGELSIQLVQINTKRLLNAVKNIYSEYSEWRKMSVSVDEDSEEIEICSDRALITRILMNMVKNALEAIKEGEEVQISCKQYGECCVFTVHNPGFIPKEVQLQIFQRSFSTKGKGRGVGTYSIKMFGERYLNGKVWFTTSENSGTNFNISIPIAFSGACDVDHFDTKVCD